MPYGEGIGERAYERAYVGTPLPFGVREREEERGRESEGGREKAKERGREREHLHRQSTNN